MRTTSPAATLPAPHASALSRSAILAYGVTCYAIGMAGLSWLILTTLGVLSFSPGPVTFGSTGAAIAFNLSFLALFGIQHAIMARPAFKERWTRVIPPAMERATFVLLAGLIMAAAMFFWQPLTASIWSVENAALAAGIRVLGALGWGYLLAASFAIDHFELFGLKQVWRNFTGDAPAQVPLVTRLMYRFDRHPLMTGILFGVWCTPSMRLDHLVLALGLTAYIVIGVLIEERTLVQLHGDDYRDYRREVGALVPLPGKRG